MTYTVTKASALIIGLPLVLAVAVADDTVRDDLDLEQQRAVNKVIQLPTTFLQAESFEAMSGGATTRREYDLGKEAYSRFLSNLDAEGQQSAAIGNSLFRKAWVAAPASTQSSDGLGPFFNARSCQGCHIKDGRGTAPREGEFDPTFLLKFPTPHDLLGSQLQTASVTGLPAEGRYRTFYHTRKFIYPDGAVKELRYPEYVVFTTNGERIKERVSPRMAPAVFGLGLIDAIHVADQIRLSDESDANGDGISGALPWIGDRPGKYAWKLQNVSLRQQSADAFSNDMGLSSAEFPLHYGDCTLLQQACRNANSGADAEEDVEITRLMMSLVEQYLLSLAPPRRRDVSSPGVLRGKKSFYEFQCHSCHHPKYVTRADYPQKALRYQLIWPYSDFLLHDMGSDLSDGVGDSEWRTPPLWGLGYVKTVNPLATFLHDGRAKDIEEAILWHGGEAAEAKARFVEASETQRADLVRFLESL